MADSPVTITTLGHGPLEVSGPVTVRTASGEVVFEGERTFLCRCGHSAKKPFCDGSHKREGFTDDQDLPAGTGKSA